MFLYNVINTCCSYVMVASQYLQAMYHPSSITYQVVALDIHSRRIRLFSLGNDSVKLHVFTGGIQRHRNNCHRKIQCHHNR